LTRYYWYELCPRCGFGGGGRLTIYEDITNRRLYLQCDECEWGWRNPEKANDQSAGFLTLTEEFEARLADWATIQRYGWEKYAKESYEE
jgi:hypothetical protein